ncbi:MAG: hypothetical protein PUP93_16735 [Rhizonema sp. NSF051]|nr:hypothetical protein [Rhizonema sp. NSF051]
MKYLFYLPKEQEQEFGSLRIGAEKIFQILIKNLVELRDLMAYAYLVETGEIGMSICQRFDDGIEKWWIQRIQDRTTDDYLERLQRANAIPHETIETRSKGWSAKTSLKASEAAIVVSPSKGIWLERHEPVIALQFFL